MDLLLLMPCNHNGKCGVYLRADFKRLYFTLLILWSSKRTYRVFKYRHVNSAPSEAFQEADKDTCMSIKIARIVPLLGLPRATIVRFCS
jgi:hypothetical protein